MRFEGKVAIVTGAAQGIGEAYAKALAAEGAAVVVADLNIESGEQVAKARGVDRGRTRRGGDIRTTLREGEVDGERRRARLLRELGQVERQAGQRAAVDRRYEKVCACRWHPRRAFPHRDSTRPDHCGCWNSSSSRGRRNPLAGDPRIKLRGIVRARFPA